MSSINSHFTFIYSQPSEYRLSHDSVFFARQIFEQMKTIELSGTKALDICAGAGVVGMDFLFHRRTAGESVPLDFDFVDVQNVYEEHFAVNALRLGSIGTRLKFLCFNYNELLAEEYKNAYSLIVCNPPYFLPDLGKLSPSVFKNRCKFFIDSDLNKLMCALFNCLKPDGVCFMMLKDLPQHGLQILAEVRDFSKNKLLIENLGHIRGTSFLRITALKPVEVKEIK